MQILKKPIILLLSAILALPASSFAQYLFQVEPFFNYFKDAGRYELFGSLVVPQATFDGVVRVNNGALYQGDSNAKRSITGSAIGGGIGLSIPIKATGHISCFAVGLQLMGNMYTWTDLNKTMNFSDGSYVAGGSSLGGTTLQIGMPIGLEYKAGNDCIKTKRLPFGTTLGVGLIPQVTMTSLTNVTTVDSKMSFGATPYLKAEGSVFIGMDVKVRVMYTMGDITLIDVNKAIPSYTDGPFKLTSNSNLMVSLILMPFSPGWRETNWWNTHDTYNYSDKLN